MPKISVIIPVYNVEKYLRECLDSVINQTLKDIEIICINDGSTDSSLKILEEFAHIDSRIIVINQENQGQGAARNKGIEVANGEYIAFLDPDDFIDLDTFEVVYNRFKETNVDIVQFDYQTCEENGTFKEYHNLSKEMKKHLSFTLKDNQIFSLKDFPYKDFAKTRLNVWDKIYNSNLIKQNNICFAPTKNGEDHIFSIGATLLAKKILYINKYLYHYRMRFNSSIHILSDINFGVFENIEILKKFLLNHNLNNVYKKAFNQYSINACATHYSMLPLENNDLFKSMCKDLLSTEQYKSFLKEIKPKFNFLQRIFSIKNHRSNGIKYKYLCILGMNFIINKKEKLLSKYQ